MMPWMRKKNATASQDEANYMHVSDFSLRTQRQDVSKKPEAASFGTANANARPARPTRPEDGEVTIPRQMYHSLLQDAEDADKVTGLIERTLAASDHTMEELTRERAGCHLVVMTEGERRAWAQLKRVSGATGDVDCLQELRTSLAGVARVAKQLELRFDAPANEGVRQQHAFERLAYEAEHGPDHRDRDHTGTGTRALASLDREAEALLFRMKALLSKAEAGVEPFCGHVMDLGDGDDAATGELTTVAVVQGRSVATLLADTLRHMASLRPDINAVDLARVTWSRCDADLRADLGGEPQAADGQPAGLVRRWLRLSGTREFHREQVRLARRLQAQAQAAGRCRRCRPADDPASRRPADPADPAVPASSSRPQPSSHHHQPGSTSRRSGSKSSTDARVDGGSSRKPEATRKTSWK